MKYKILERIDVLNGYASFKRNGTVKDKRSSRWNHQRFSLNVGDLVEFNRKKGELTILFRADVPCEAHYDSSELDDEGVTYQDLGKFHGAILKGWTVPLSE